MKRRKKAPEKIISIRKFPGQILQKYIQTGKPTFQGHYICFCTPIDEEANSSTFPMSKHNVLYWNGKKWMPWQTNAYGVVLGWIGPLPNLSLDEMMDFAPNEAALTLFFIGYEEDSTIFKFSSGPHYSYFSAFLNPGKKGQFIFQLNSRKTKAIKWAKWSTKTKKWKRIREYIEKKYPWQGKGRKNSYKAFELKPKKKRKKRKSLGIR